MNPHITNARIYAHALAPLHAHADRAATRLAHGPDRQPTAAHGMPGLPTECGPEQPPAPDGPTRWGVVFAALWEDGADTRFVFPVSTYDAASALQGRMNFGLTWADLDAGDVALLMVDRGHGWTVRNDPRVSRARNIPAFTEADATKPACQTDRDGYCWTPHPGRPGFLAEVTASGRTDLTRIRHVNEVTRRFGPLRACTKHASRP